MSIEREPEGRPVGVGAVGVRPGEQDGILAQLPQGELYRLVAFSDEGLENPGTQNRPVTYHADYNMMLRDPQVELVLVDGPLDLRHDFAIRALHAGRHVVIREPFSESALSAERVMKTALRGRLLATTDLRMREDADLRALLHAIEAENVPTVHGAFCFREFPADADPTSAAGPDQGLLQSVGMPLLYQVRKLVKDDAKSVSTHVRAATAQRPDDAFLIYLALRGKGWVVIQCARQNAPELPRWALYAGEAAFTARDGTAMVVAGGPRRTYSAPAPAAGFWENLFDALRHDAPLECHPVDIVRAMKLHEAALESAATGQPVTV
jgi:predicted dehydrogenase